jgi:hypothetical protein
MREGRTAQAAPHTCPGCAATFVKLSRARQHVVGRHKGQQAGWSDQQLRDHGFRRCTCGKVCTKRGIKGHQTKAGCQAGREESSSPVPETQTTQQDDTQAEEEEEAPQGDRYECLLLHPTLATPLPPHVLRHFQETADLLASAYIKDPCEKTLLDILALPKEALVPNVSKSRERSLHKALRTASAGGSSIPVPLPKLKKAAAWETKVQRAVKAGRISQAARLLRGNHLSSRPHPRCCKRCAICTLKVPTIHSATLVPLLQAILSLSMAS